MLMTFHTCRHIISSYAVGISCIVHFVDLFLLLIKGNKTFCRHLWPPECQVHEPPGSLQTIATTAVLSSALRRGGFLCKLLGGLVLHDFNMLKATWHEDTGELCNAAEKGSKLKRTFQIFPGLTF